MRQLAVELRRFWARRAIALTLLLATGAALVLLGATVWSTRSVTESEANAASAQLETERTALQDDLEQCRKRQEALGAPQPDQASQDPCEDLDPQLEWFLPREQLDLAAELSGTGLALALIMAGAAIVVGATFAGADWHSRSLSTQLLFRPARLRLWGAKALAVVLGVTMVVASVSVLYWGALAGVARARGMSVAGSTLQDIALQETRSVVLSAAAALGAYALTMALRSTLAALALLFTYAAAGEALLASLSIDESGRWSLANNVQAWVLGGIRVYDESLCAPGAGASCDATFGLSGAHGAVYLGVLLALAVVASLVTFARRDLP